MYIADNVRGVFRLKQVYEEQISGNWPTTASSEGVGGGSPSPYPYGYFGGGPGPLTTVDRIDYSNDTATASVKGPLSFGRYYIAATGNGSYGYFGGGLRISASFPSYSIVDRIDYSNDTATASPKGPLSFARYTLAATGNSSYGYFGGGFVLTPTYYSTVDRIDYSNDTVTASPKGPLSSASAGRAATGNSSFGYFGGGAPDPLSTVDRIDYSNDTATASVRGPLSSARYWLAATGNSSYGYFGGGYNDATTTEYSTVDRIDYSNDTATASPKGPLSSTSNSPGATGNSSFGYFAGRIPGPRSTVDRIDYSNDTATASPKGPLSSARDTLAGASAEANGLSGGGGSLLPENNPTQIRPFGYFGGGTFYGSLSKVDRIDYSNDTATASVKGPLSAARRYFSATGNSSYGYFGGGYSAFSTVDRIDYFNDTATASPKGPLSLGRFGIAATGNSSYGYFGGGRNNSISPSSLSTVDRIDYNNDTATASPKGPLSVGRYFTGATGNADYGYFSGGYTISPAFVYSTVDRIDYSNDTATASPKGPLSSARWILAATGNGSFGYFGGAYITFSTVDRIDYSNDTATASVKGPLSAGKHHIAATGDGSFGYFGGGFIGYLSFSTVDRIDYTNDTVTASVKGPLSAARYALAATSPTANGL